MAMRIFSHFFSCKNKILFCKNKMSYRLCNMLLTQIKDWNEENLVLTFNKKFHKISIVNNIFISQYHGAVGQAWRWTGDAIYGHARYKIDMGCLLKAGIDWVAAAWWTKEETRYDTIESDIVSVNGMQCI